MHSPAFPKKKAPGGAFFIVDIDAGVDKFGFGSDTEAGVDGSTHHSNNKMDGSTLYAQSDLPDCIPARLDQLQCLGMCDNNTCHTRGSSPLRRRNIRRRMIAASALPLMLQK